MHGITENRITPEMFLTDEPPARTIGVECEYNLQPGVDAINGRSYNPSDYITQEAILNAGIRSISGYTELGSRIYPDVGHAEYCTPECLGPYEAAAADIAGIAILSSIVEASGLPNAGLYRISGTAIKDATPEDRKKFTNGVHENFIAPASLATTGLLLPHILPTYYATRVAAMSGGVVQNQYQFSQKVHGIGGDPLAYRLDRRTMAGGKPMALVLSGETETVGGKWLRLETRYADAPLSLASRRHALATTSLMLRLCEHEDMFNKDDFDDIILKNPVEATHLFMTNLSLQQTAETRSGKRLTMIDINEKLAEKVLFLCDRIALPQDEQHAATIWPTINDAFRRSKPKKVQYDDYLLLNYGVATKHYWLSRIGAFGKGDAESKTRSLQWDRILPIGNGRRMMDQMIEGDPDIERLKKSAPLTRAAVRSQFIQEHFEAPFARVANWSSGTKPDGTSTIFSDPFGYRTE